MLLSAYVAFCLCCFLPMLLPAYVLFHLCCFLPMLFSAYVVFSLWCFLPMLLSAYVVFCLCCFLPMLLSTYVALCLCCFPYMLRSCYTAFHLSFLHVCIYICKYTCICIFRQNPYSGKYYALYCMAAYYIYTHTDISICYLNTYTLCAVTSPLCSQSPVRWDK